MHAVQTWQVGRKDTVFIEILTKLTDKTNSISVQKKYTWKIHKIQWWWVETKYVYYNGVLQHFCDFAHWA